MNTYGVDLMGRRRRRRHTAEFKAAVIEECLRPGVSIAAVALAHGLNANMLRKWVIDAEHKIMAPPPSAAAEPEPQPMPPPTREQLDALVLGLPWHRIGEAGVIGLT
ncbi:MAG: transposase [Roseateles sp.]|uniref:transposase n=1 Tax=Roseateles sp. TaxID=1971397 RepID=UPI0039EB33BC